MNAGWGLLTDLGYVLQQLTDVTNQLLNEGQMECDRRIIEVV